MSTDVGLEERGVCLEAVLTSGVPAGDDLDEFISTIDHELSENQRKLEQCMKEILDYETELSCGTSRRCSVSAVDALKQICDCQLLDKYTCYDVNTGALQQILIHLLKTLEAVADSEDVILKVLTDLVSGQGLCLPECNPAAQAAMSSVQQLFNTTIDTGEQAVEATWKQLCVLLQRRFLERLKQISAGPGTALERRQLVTSLCILLPRTVAASQYCSTRQQQLDSCIGQCLCASGDPRQHVKASVEGFKAAVNRILTMMSDDVELFMTGCLTENLEEAFQLLASIYFDCLEDEIGLLVDKIANELVCPRPADTKSDEVMVAKSPSDGRLFGHCTGVGYSRHTQSHNGAFPTVTGNKIHPRAVAWDLTDLHGINSEMFDIIVDLVDSLLTFDCRIDVWRSLMSSNWRRVIDDEKPRQCLKSALKSESREDVVTEIQKEKPRKVMSGIRDECLHNAVHPVCMDDKQIHQKQCSMSSTSQHAPLLKGLCMKLMNFVDSILTHYFLYQEYVGISWLVGEEFCGLKWGKFLAAYQSSQVQVSVTFSLFILYLKPTISSLRVLYVV